MLAGLLTPSSGEAAICGLSVSGDSLAIKRKIGVLPENLGLFDDLTVEEHLLLTGQIHGVPAHVTSERIEQLLKALSLADGRNTFAGQCSHGMRKKTAFAMALLPNPEVLLLDEPFEAIDPIASRAMHEILARAARRGVTVLLTSHILSVLERIANQFVIIRGGKVVWNSSAEALPRSLEELYLELAESPVMEELEWLGSGRS